MRSVFPSRFLKRALGADALVSGAVALLQLLAAGALAEQLALPGALLLGTGVFLLGYVALLVMLARAQRVPAALILLVVAGNVLWAVGALGWLLGDSLTTNIWGEAWLLLHVAAVLVFAALEWAGLRASPMSGSTQAARA